MENKKGGISLDEDIPPIIDYIKQA